MAICQWSNLIAQGTSYNISKGLVKTTRLLINNM